MAPPSPVAALPGLGPRSQDMLAAAGIVSVEQLKALGAVKAFVMVKRAGGKPSLNLLWGLESAISGEHWQAVAKHHRTSLLLALEDAERHAPRFKVSPARKPEEPPC